MCINTDILEYAGLPRYLSKSEIFMDWICALSYASQKKLWACNDKIVQKSAKQFADMNLLENLTPAILAYDGIQYTTMSPDVFEKRHITYIQQHLNILSGFYGVLRPMDGVVPYRLGMQARAAVPGYSNLYDFWGDSLYRAVLDESRIIINLASVEYARCVEKYLKPEDRFITCIFGELENGQVIQKGVYAKMARGEMVRYMAETEAERPEQLKDFERSGYHFDASRSTETEYVFIRTEVPGKRKHTEEADET